jgi:hypothetical protein
LIVHEEERPVPGDRPAQDEAELVALERGLVRVVGGGGREEVPGVEGLVAQELEPGSVQLVATCLRAQVDHATVEPPELRGRGVGHDLEFLDHR